MLDADSCSIKALCSSLSLSLQFITLTSIPFTVYTSFMLIYTNTSVIYKKNSCELFYNLKRCIMFHDEKLNDLHFVYSVVNTLPK